MDKRDPNRLLRRVDWRFLLANPKPEKTICFSDGILRQAVEHISASLVSPGDSKMGQCDLAVALNPTQAVLRSAFDSLSEDGEIYTEWYSPLVGGAKGVRRRLEKMGFTNVVCYWAWSPPTLAPSLYWLPLDSPKTLHYFFKNRRLSPSILVRMARFVLQMILALGLHNRLLVPVCAIARKTAFDKQQDFQAQINTEIFRCRLNGSLAQSPGPLNWMLWTPGHRLINKIVALVFSETEEKPILVIKIPRSRPSLSALASEVHNLTQLANREKSFENSVPSILFTLDWKGITVAGESFVVGSPIYTFLDQDSYPELARKVTNWLMMLASGSRPSPRPEWWDRLVGSALEEFSQSFRLVFSTKELSCIHHILNQLNDLPIVFEQRDCSPWNILMNEKGEIRVLDWESSEPNGLPALDLIYFLTYLSFFVNGAMESKEYLKEYRNAFNLQTFTGKINHECLHKYFADLNVDPSARRPLRLLTWLIHSRSEYRSLVEDAGGTPTPSALQTSLFATLIREEIRPYSGVDSEDEVFDRIMEKT